MMSKDGNQGKDEPALTTTLGVTTSLRIPVALHRRLWARAKAHGKYMAALAELAVEFYLEIDEVDLRRLELKAAQDGVTPPKALAAVVSDWFKAEQSLKLEKTS